MTKKSPPDAVPVPPDPVPIRTGTWLAAYQQPDPKPTRKEDLPRKSGGEEKFANDIKKKPGQVDGEESRGGKVARKLDFGAAK